MLSKHLEELHVFMRYSTYSKGSTLRYFNSYIALRYIKPACPLYTCPRFDHSTLIFSDKCDKVPYPKDFDLISLVLECITELARGVLLRVLGGLGPLISPLWEERALLGLGLGTNELLLLSIASTEACNPSITVGDIASGTDYFNFRDSDGGSVPSTPVSGAGIIYLSV